MSKTVNTNNLWTSPTINDYRKNPKTNFTRYITFTQLKLGDINSTLKFSHIFLRSGTLITFIYKYMLKSFAGSQPGTCQE